MKTMVLINGGNLVQTFFFISGFLNSTALLSYVDKNHVKDISVFIKTLIYRIVRFVPVLLFLVLLHATWLNRFDDGPYWDKFTFNERQSCRTNMWTNLLLINNYVSGDLKCMIHTWYIAADFHLGIIGTAMLLIIVKWEYFNFIKIINIFFIVIF
jgi:peptidoglycan/LPS O-acetylase OafA/YrhL